MKKPGSYFSRSFLLKACLLLLAFLGYPVPRARCDSRVPLSTAAEVHNLTPSQASRGIPVHLTGVITYYNPSINPENGGLFIQDSSGAVYVWVPKDYQSSHEALAPGDLIDLRGTTGPGDFAAVVNEPTIRVLPRSRRLPAPQRVSLTQLLTGGKDCEWVEIEGVVRSVSEYADTQTLEIATADGTLGATAVQSTTEHYDDLVDAKVRIRGVAAALFNRDRQIRGARLYFPSRSQIIVEDPAPLDPFSTRVAPLRELAAFVPKMDLPRRVHVKGAVTLQWPGSLLCVQDQVQGLCAQTAERTPLKLGQIVDLSGFPSLGEYRPSMEDAIYRRAGSNLPVSPFPITADQAMSGDFDAQLVQLEGTLIGRDVVSKSTTVLLSSGKLTFPVSLPPEVDARSITDIPNGSKLRVIGICSVQLDGQRTRTGFGFVVNKSFRIFLRRPGDVVIIQRPSKLTAKRVLLALALVGTITFAVFAWVLVLRKRVEQQTRLLRESEERFRHMAQHDALTGLPTRSLLHERLKEALTRVNSSTNRLALLMLDLDNFKGINDSFGHHAGDKVLCSVSDRLCSVLRKQDVVARMGGDEFVVLLSHLASDAEAERVAARVLASVSKPMMFNGAEIKVSVSIGVRNIDAASTDVDSLLNSADAAMYSAKSSGRNRLTLYSEALGGASSRLNQIRVHLTRALDLGEFSLHYQPLVAFQSGCVSGFEALLRWNSRELGSVSPAEFIPVAEESELIVRIGDWVIDQACREMAVLEEATDRSFLLAVNVSAKQLLKRGLPNLLFQTLTKYGRKPHCLKLEITESSLVSSSPNVLQALQQIRSLGVHLAIDDFGVGFSSFSYVTKLPIDCIKIDRSLICDLAEDRRNLAVLRAIIAMAHGLGLRVVAEGVETAEQFGLLTEEHCDTAQGYLLSRPVPSQELIPVVDRIESSSSGRNDTKGVAAITSELNLRAGCGPVFA